MQKLHSCSDCIYYSPRFLSQVFCLCPKICKPNFINGGVFPVLCSLHNINGDCVHFVPSGFWARIWFYLTSYKVNAEL